jgi:hypothetical protein
MEIENQSRLFSRGFQETSYIEPTNVSIGPPVYFPDSLV